MAFTDRLLTCNDCGEEFIFTAGEQIFFLEKEFKNDPKRCKLCKARLSRRGSSAPISQQSLRTPTETRLICSNCEEETTVPFKPRHGRPVFCRHCFQLQQAAGTTATAP